MLGRLNGLIKIIKKKPTLVLHAICTKTYLTCNNHYNAGSKKINFKRVGLYLILAKY
jgi:hypothetical protein